jgi:hypothetical protein
MVKTITYGIGGHDETKPNNNIVEEVDLTNTEEEII